MFRDALMTAFDVLGSDLRYKRKDLAVYLAYLTKQGKKANKGKKGAAPAKKCRRAKRR